MEVQTQLLIKKKKVYDEGIFNLPADTAARDLPLVVSGDDGCAVFIDLYFC